MFTQALSLALLPTSLQAPAPRAVDAIDLLPTSANIVLELGDLGAALSTPEAERGDWLRFLTDERVVTPFLEMATDPFDEELMVHLHRIVLSVHGGAASMDATDDSYGLFVLDVDEHFVPALVAMSEDNDTPLMTTQIAGHEVLADGTDIDVMSLALLEQEGRVFIGLGEPGSVAAPFTELLERTERAADETPWWEANDPAGVDALVGLHLDFVNLPLPVELQMLTQNFVDSFYVGFELGAGRNGGLVFSGHLVEGEVVDAFRDCFAGEANHDLLLAAPEGVTSAQVFDLDLNAFLDAILALVEASAPEEDAVAMVEGGLDSASTVIGLDIREDLLANLTGDIFMFQWMDDVDGLLQEDPDAVLDMFPVVGMGLADSEPFIELLENLETLVSAAGGELLDEDDATVLRIVDEEEGLEVMVRVSDSYLTLAADSSRHEATLERLGQRRFDGLVDQKTFAACESTLDGAAVAIMDPAMILEFAASLVTMDETIPEDVATQVEGIIDAALDHISGLVMTDGWMGERSIGSRFLTR